jgi:hypothetical protein
MPAAFSPAANGSRACLSVKLTETPCCLKSSKALFSGRGDESPRLQEGKAVKGGRRGGHRLCTSASAEDWEEAVIVRRRLVRFSRDSRPRKAVVRLQGDEAILSVERRGEKGTSHHPCRSFHTADNACGYFSRIQVFSRAGNPCQEAN